MITSFVLLLAAQAAVPPSTVVARNADKLQCHLEYHIYSRIAERVCLPASTWAQMAKENEADIHASRNSRASGLLGTIVNGGEGEITKPQIPGWPK